MATVHVRYTCGCGFGADDVEAAKRHANSKGHTLTVLGVVKAPSKVPQRTEAELRREFGALREPFHM